MNFRSLFAPPVFPGDEEKNIEAVTLNNTVWAVIGLILFSLLRNLVDPNGSQLLTICNIIFLGIALGARYSIQKGRLKWPSLTLIFLGTIYITLTLVVYGSVRSSAFLAYVLIITVSGFHFQLKGIVISTIAIGLLTLAVIFAQNQGVLPPPDYSVGIAEWIFYTAILGLIGNFIYTYEKIIRYFLQRSQKEVARQKSIEEQLRIYSLVVNQNPTAIMITDANGKIEQINPKFIEVTGYSKEEVIGKTPRILKSGRYPAAFYERMWHTILSGKTWQGQLQNRKKNGQLYWEKTSIAPLTNSDGEIQHFVAIKEDVTKDIKAQNVAKETNRKLKDQLAQIHSLQEKLKHQALHDALTGLHNRYYMEEALQKEFARAERSQSPLSVVLLDLDRLKELNDTGGHSTGDLALRKFARHLRTSIREGDTVCRYGGDEFAVILPNTSAEDAFSRAKELNKRMETVTLLYRKDKMMRISFTAGVATYPDHGETIGEIFTYADVALYRAKLKGRNRVELFSVE